MAFCLDLSKVVTVSFLYQYWDALKTSFKYYLLTAVLILMTITSAGSFGYLSSAFQKAVQPVMEISLKIDSYKHERDNLVAEKDELIKQRTDIDKQVAQLPPDYVKGRQKLIASFKPEEDRIRNRLGVITKRTDELSTQILQVQNENIDKEVHAGPIVYVAKAFDISVEQASKWVILIIIFVFDPLAVCLLIAGNFLVKRRRGLPKDIQRDEGLPKDIQPLPIIIQTDEGLPKDIPDPELRLKEFEEGPRVVTQAQAELEAILDRLYGSEPEPEPKFPFEVVSVDDDGEVIPEEPKRLLSHEVMQEHSRREREAKYTAQNPPPPDPDPHEIFRQQSTIVAQNALKKLQSLSSPLTEEERQLLTLVYDDVDTGEEPDDRDINPIFLATVIQDYVPVNPLQINVTGDTSYSGAPQAELIEEPRLRSSLEDLKINLPDALLQRSYNPSSSKKSLYE